MSIDQNLILDAKGDSNAVFVFVAPTAFNTSAAITVFLQNGAQASNIARSNPFARCGDAWSIGCSSFLTLTNNLSKDPGVQFKLRALSIIECTKWFPQTLFGLVAVRFAEA